MSKVDALGLKILFLLIPGIIALGIVKSIGPKRPRSDFESSLQIFVYGIVCYAITGFLEGLELWHTWVPLKTAKRTWTYYKYPPSCYQISLRNWPTSVLSNSSFVISRAARHVSDFPHIGETLARASNSDNARYLSPNVTLTALSCFAVAVAVD